MDKLSKILVILIATSLIILGLMNVVISVYLVEYEYSEELAALEIASIRDDNGTLSTLSHPEIFGFGSFNITLPSSIWSKYIELNESVSEVRIACSSYAEIPHGQGGPVRVYSGADLNIVLGNITMNRTFPTYSMEASGGCAQWISLALTVNRSLLEMANASELFVSFECKEIVESNYTYFVNYGMELRVDLQYAREVSLHNPLPCISIMTLGICSLVLLTLEMTSAQNKNIDSLQGKVSVHSTRLSNWSS